MAVKSTGTTFFHESVSFEGSADLIFVTSNYSRVINHWSPYCPQGWAASMHTGKWHHSYA